MSAITTGNPLDQFASAKATSSATTYTETHAAVTIDDYVMQAVKRDTDGLPFVRISRKDSDAKPRYDRADRVAKYLRALAAQS